MTAAKQQKQEAAQEAEHRSAYEAAEKLLADGDYDAAIEAFNALGDYADASDRAAEAETAKQAAEEEAANKEAYAAAEKLLEKKKYADAQAAFEALGEYSDAKEKAEECQKQLDAQTSSNGSTANKPSTQNDSNANGSNNSDGTYTLIDYNTDGTIAKKTGYNADGSVRWAEVYSYNSAGQLISCTKYLRDILWMTDYYENGRKIRTEYIGGSTEYYYYTSDGQLDYTMDVSSNGGKSYYRKDTEGNKIPYDPNGG